MRKERRTPIPAVIAFALLCAVLISSHFVTGMYARYTIQEDGEGVVRVASFGAEATADEVDPVTITADGTDDSGKAVYTVTVKNTGEVTVRYTAAVEFTGDDAEENAAKFDASNGNLTFTGVLGPGGTEQRIVTFDMSAYSETNDKWSTYSNDDISGVSGKAPFTVTVRFTQID